METKHKKAIQAYQCPGCIIGHDISCFEKAEGGNGCGKHRAGTFISHIGKVYLGMPKGFNRVGDKECPIEIHTTLQAAKDEFSNIFGKYTVSVWKYLNEKNHTFVRSYCPRLNYTMIYIFLENCMDKIDAIEITAEDIDYMD